MVNNSKWFSRPSFYVAMVSYFAMSYSTLAYGDQWAAMLYPEDHYFENVGAISLFVASALSFYTFLRALGTRKITNMHWVKQSVYLGLGILFFYGGDEEISWGQRIFDFKTPDPVAQMNEQDEFNTHNLEAWQNSELLNANRLFDIFWFSFAVLIPAGSLVWRRFKQFAERLIPIVYWGIGLLFLVNYLGAKLAKLVFVSIYTFQSISFTQAVQEIKESNYELLLVFLSLVLLWNLNSLIHEKIRIGFDLRCIVR